MKYMICSGLGRNFCYTETFLLWEKRGEREREAKFIKINGALHTRARRFLWKPIFHNPFKPSADWRDLFTFASSLEPFAWFTAGGIDCFVHAAFPCVKAWRPVPIVGVFKFGWSIDLVFYVLPVWMSAICSFLHGRSADRFYSITCHRDSPSGMIKKTILFPQVDRHERDHWLA